MKNLKKTNPHSKAYHYAINKIKVLPIACFAVFMVFTACSTDDILGGCGNLNWIQEVEKELNTWVNASNTYSNDPTTANCNNYKSAGNDYLNSLEKIKKCVPGTSKKEFDQAIQEAKTSLDQSNCQ